MQPNKHGAFSTAKTGEDAPVSICCPQNDGKQCRKQLPAANAPAMNSASGRVRLFYRVRTLGIRRQLVRDREKGGEYHFSTPKNGKIRVIVLAPTVVQLFHEQESLSDP